MWFPMLVDLALAAGPDAWLDAVVRLEVGSTTCAGVVVDAEGTVATAYHCVAPGGRPRVHRRDGEVAIGRVTAVDRGRDLALIAAPELGGTAHLSLRSDLPPVGATVWAMGHPLGSDLPGGFYTDTLRFSVAEGVVSAVGTEAIQTTVPLNPGNSGGPLVDDRGRVVGIISRRAGGQGLGFAGRVDTLEARPTHPLSPVGGTIALEAALLAMDNGALVVGPRVELAARDRLVVSVSGGIPLSARWSTARFGSTRFLRGEGSLALRQRLGRGAWALRVDAFAGVSALETMTAAPDDPFRWTTERRPVASVGGVVRIRNVGFELGWSPVEGAGRASVILRTPGVFQVW